MKEFMGYLRIRKCLSVVVLLGVFGVTAPTAKSEVYSILPLASSLHAYKRKVRALVPIQNGTVEVSEGRQLLQLALSPADTVFLSDTRSRKNAEIRAFSESFEIEKFLIIKNTSSEAWEVLSWNEITLPNGMMQLQVSALNKVGTKLNLRALLRKP